MFDDYSDSVNDIADDSPDDAPDDVSDALTDAGSETDDVSSDFADDFWEEKAQTAEESEGFDDSVLQKDTSDTESDAVSDTSAKEEDHEYRDEMKDDLPWILGPAFEGDIPAPDWDFSDKAQDAVGEATVPEQLEIPDPDWDPEFADEAKDDAGEATEPEQLEIPDPDWDPEFAAEAMDDAGEAAKPVQSKFPNLPTESRYGEQTDASDEMKNGNPQELQEKDEDTWPLTINPSDYENIISNGTDREKEKIGIAIERGLIIVAPEDLPNDSDEDPEHSPPVKKLIKK